MTEVEWLRLDPIIQEMAIAVIRHGHLRETHTPWFIECAASAYIRKCHEQGRQPQETSLVGPAQAIREILGVKKQAN